MKQLKARVLLVEDDRGLRDLLAEELEEQQLQVKRAETAKEARFLLEEEDFDLIISDLRLPDADGLQLLKGTRLLDEPPSFIMITAFATVSRAVEALKAGADDFLTKPLDLDHFQLCVSRVLETHSLKRRLKRYRQVLEEDRFHGMIGECEAMRLLFGQIRQVARAEGPVLITGESGVGKELVAQAVHRESPRRNRPFVAINCASVPRELMESEFFGHVAGAFTGATRRQSGLLIEADRGALFLDEIAEMPPGLQVKLLRVLEDGKVRPLGSSKERKIDVRVLAASNRNMEEAVKSGDFRRDLFYRLETFTLKVPPLRERGEDLELLVAHFWNRFNLKTNRDIRRISPEAMRQLQDYPFPGNVRELKNAMERAVAFCDGEEIGPNHLPERIRRHRGRTLKPLKSSLFLPSELLDDEHLPSVKEMERLYVQYVLDRVDGNKRRAAGLLGISRTTIYRHLERRKRSSSGRNGGSVRDLE